MTVNLDQNEWLRDDDHADISALTLTWHIGYFNPLPANQELSDRLTAINGILTSIHEEYDKSTPAPAVLCVSNPVSIVKMSWGSIPVRLRFVLHTEIVSLAIYLDIGLIPPGSQDPVVSRIREYLPNIGPNVTTVVAGFHVINLLQECRRYLFETVWDEFSKKHKEKIPFPRIGNFLSWQKVQR